MSKTAIIVGRWQTPDLHIGHKYILSHAASNYDKVVVLVGTTPTRFTTRNPLPYEAIRYMLKQYLGKVEVGSIMDEGSDQVWSEKLDKICEKYEDPILLGSRDCFISHYTGRFPTKEIASPYPHQSGTQMRASIKRKNSRLFRQGIIWAVNHKFPSAYPTVDIAILRDTYWKGIEKNYNEIVLGRKPGSVSWCIPGGFVDPTDPSLESAALREAKEEVGDSELGHPFYLGSTKVNDWRYRGTSDGIITSIFGVEWLFGTIKAGDDLEEVRWFDINDADNFIAEHHKPLLKIIKEKIK